MALPSGIRILKPGDRLFDPMSKVITVIDGLSIAIMAVQSGGHFAIKGKCTTTRCSSFPLIVKLPLLMPMLAVVNGNPLPEIVFSIEPKPDDPSPPPPGKKETAIAKYGHTVLRAITPIYVDLYEHNLAAIEEKFPGEYNTAWPPLFNFARLLRNLLTTTAA